MLYEMRTYRIRVGQLDRYLREFEEKAMPILSRHWRLVGFWTLDTGELNRVMHIWAFDDLAHRNRARAAVLAEPGWRDGFLPIALQLVEHQETTFMTAAPFSPTP